MTREEGKKLIAERVEDFERNKVVLTKKGHGETNIRSNYIDKLFEALGWNMTNVYEVVREYSQRDRSSAAGMKKVDYALKIKGKLKLFIEAKEASVNLETDKDAIYQAKRYAYSSNGRAPIVILTDFEEFRVFNVIKAPDYDNTDRELLKNQSMRYTDYVEKWDILWDTFSREAVEGGSLDRLRGKIDKNTKTMDADFLDAITKWRETLARNIANRNDTLNVQEINEAVQRILDRLIFIRNLEDREIEPENTLLDARKKEDIYKTALIPLFRSLDKTYNGLLFKRHFSEEIVVDDKTLKEVIREMCYPVSPFQFDIIEPEILGRVYEKFLGSKIRLTEGHRVKIEEKMEVRKAGGVYYTPEYIVEYIVNNTVGKKIEGLTPDEIKAIKILDPACGSGSFLLGAYSCLLEYHRNWYAEHKQDKSYKNDWYLTSDEELKVRLDKRADILRNNIFGVDIDHEATEVSIMSLYLKMLDDGFDKGQQDLFFAKGSILPDMSENIKCGNSLIGSDYFDGKLDIDLEELRTIKPFDWAAEGTFNKETKTWINRGFPEIMKNGGFDCVIGNPPWGALLSDGSLAYCKKKYSDIVKRIIDSFMFFVRKSIQICTTNGYTGLVLPDVILYQVDNCNLRKHILDNCHLRTIVNMGNVFVGVTRPCCVITMEKRINNSIETETEIAFVKNLSAYSESEKQRLISGLPDTIDLKIVRNITNYLFITERVNEYDVLKTIIQKNSGKLIDLIDEDGIQRGVSPDLKEAFIVDSTTSEKYNLEKSYLKSVVTGGVHVKPFSIMKPDLLLIYTTRDTKYEEVPNICNYIEKYREKITCREVKENKHSIYSLHRSRDKNIFEKKSKLVGVITADRIIVSIDKTLLYCTDGLYVFGLKDSRLEEVLEAILNSNTITYIYRLLSMEEGRVLAQVKPAIINNLPMPNFPGSREIIDEIKQNVGNMKNMLRKRNDTHSESDKKIYADMIGRAIGMIDSCVYKLYGLTDDEIKIIEESTTP